MHMHSATIHAQCAPSRGSSERYERRESGLVIVSGAFLENLNMCSKLVTPATVPDLALLDLVHDNLGDLLPLTSL